MADLANPQHLLDYLASTPFAATEAVRLTGGNANHVFRVRLRQAYQGRQTAVVKHGKDINFEGSCLEANRQRYEVAAMRLVAPLLAPDALVKIPEIYLYDEKENVIILEDCGEDITTLKEFLIRTTTPPSQSNASAIGVALADFLAQLHLWGAGNTAVLDRFDESNRAREIVAWVTYGRLRSTLSGEDKLPSLGDTPLDVSEADLATVGNIVTEIQQAMLTSRTTLVQGDFWPGNIMIKLQDDGHDTVEGVYVLDWEIVRPGPPGLEVGQFLAELYQSQKFSEPNAEVIRILHDAFVTRYRERVDGRIDLKEAARHATIHMGAHLTAWTPRVWFGKGDEWMRRVVLTGLKYLLDGYEDKDIEKKAPGGLLA